MARNLTIWLHQINLYFDKLLTKITFESLKDIDYINDYAHEYTLDLRVAYLLSHPWTPNVRVVSSDITFACARCLARRMI